MTITLEQYGELLERSGMPEREQARAYFYAKEYGVEALGGSGCVGFTEPTCKDWNCINPAHQVLTDDPQTPPDIHPHRYRMKRRRR